MCLLVCPFLVCLIVGSLITCTVRLFIDCFCYWCSHLGCLCVCVFGLLDHVFVGVVVFVCLVVWLVCLFAVYACYDLVCFVDLHVRLCFSLFCLVVGLCVC